MRTCGLILLLLVPLSTCQHPRPHGHALFVRNEVPSPLDVADDFEEPNNRIARQSTANMDKSVQNILNWLQGRYTQTNRRARQGSPSRQYLPATSGPSDIPTPSRDYLPPTASSSTSTQRPRPFQPSGTFTSSPSPFSSPQPPSTSYPQPTYTNGGGSPGTPTGYPYPQHPPQPSFPPYHPAQPSPPPSIAPYYPGQPTPQPSIPPYNPPQPTPQPSFPPQHPAQPTPHKPPSHPISPPYQPPGRPTSPPYQPSGRPTLPPFQPSGPETPEEPIGPGPEPSSPQPSGPTEPELPPSGPTGPGPSPSQPTGPEEPGSSPQPSYPTGPGPEPEQPTGPTGPSGPGFPDSGNTIDTGDCEECHPPHIHAIDVQCAKDMMTIDIEFNRVFNGIIYSKGFFASPECRYVNENSGQTKYSFTVKLDSCGTQFIDEFSEGKQAYLENVLVLQNEPGIQEVWDTIRSVRCLWEGNLKKALTVALSVGMLNQEIVTFSGDTATAKLDIQMGKGPFAPAATGLVKIGEPMTLVITVEGDPGFNVLVRSCVAKDNSDTSGNIVQLTDDRGCVLKPKLFGAFQTTRNPDTNSVIAYAFFQAFKFPDIMDLTIECNVELCKTECVPCPDPDQKYEPGRRRRSISNITQEFTDPVTVGRRFRVFIPQDIEETLPNTPMVINIGSPIEHESMCLSSGAFFVTSTCILSILFISCITTAVLWLKLQRNGMLIINK